MGSLNPSQYIMKRFFYMLLLAATAISCTEETYQPSFGAPTVSDCEAEVTNTTKYVTLTATITNPEQVSEAGFYVSEDASMSSVEKIVASTVSERISAEYLPDGYGKTYYYKAFISNGLDERCSNTELFKTEKFDYYVSLESTIESMTGTTATVSASLTVAKGITPTSKGFCYGEKENVTIEDNVKETTSAKLFSSAIPYEKETYIRAYVKDGKEVVYSASMFVGPVTEVNLGEEDKIVLKDESIQISAQIKPQILTGLPIDWKSSAPGIATVNSNGVIKGIKEGTAEISATVCGVTGRCEVKVVDLQDNIVVTEVSLLDGNYSSPNITSDHKVSVSVKGLSSYVSSWGIDLTSVEKSQTGQSLSDGSYSLYFSDVQTPSGKFQKDDTAFTATNNNYYFQPYVIISGNKIHCGEKTPLGLIYNKKPEISIVSVTKESTSVYTPNSSDSGSWDRRTTYALEMFLVGSLFVEASYTYYISGWAENARSNYYSEYIHPDNVHWTYRMDILWYSTSSAHDTYITEGVRATNGVDYDSPQKIRIHIGGDSISFYLESNDVKSTTSKMLNSSPKYLAMPL